MAWVVRSIQIEADRSVRRDRERTLLASWLVSLWAPVGTGVGLYYGRSAVQVAEFLRRTVELIALISAWAIYRKSKNRQRLENVASFITSAILMISGLAIVYVAVWRIFLPRPVGWVVPGFVIALLGAGVNCWFWLRHKVLASGAPSPVMEAQTRLYLTKTMVDLSVIATLTLRTLLSKHALSVYVDSAGAVLVASYMVVSSFMLARRTMKAVREHQVSDYTDPQLPPGPDCTSEPQSDHAPQS